MKTRAHLPIQTLAGIPADLVVEAHGRCAAGLAGVNFVSQTCCCASRSFAAAQCRACAREHTREWMEAAIFGSDDPDAVVIPKCQTPGCGGVVKPCITFFGEVRPRVACGGEAVHTRAS